MNERGLKNYGARHFVSAVVLESLVSPIGIYLSIVSVSTPVSNASGDVIRSTVTSQFGGFTAVTDVMLFWPHGL